MNDPRNMTTVQQGFGMMSGTQQQETQGTALAAQAKALVEARYIMAMQRPRDWDQVRQSILNECKRPRFAANKSALYNKPIGGGVEGLGIRFVEVALRHMTNVLIEVQMVYEDEGKEVHRVSVTDLESNWTHPADVRITKTVERRKPLPDGTYISTRLNSYGQPVYEVPATDDEMLNKRQAQVSKAIRTLGLRLIPGDIQDEAEETIKQIRNDKAAKDPDAERKAILDAFGELRVKAKELADYVGHGLDTCSPAELVHLRGLYGAIRDGQATWAEAMEARQSERDATAAEKQRGADDKAEAAAAKEGTRTAGVRAKVQRKKTATAPAEDAPKKRGPGRPRKKKSAAEAPADEPHAKEAGAVPPGPGGEINADWLADQLMVARDMDELNELLDLSNGIEDEKEKAAVQAIAAKRVAQLNVG